MNYQDGVFKSMTWCNNKWVSLIIILWFWFSIHYPTYALCMLSIQAYITYITHNLSALGVVRNIQVMGSSQVDALFIGGS